jgi:hypothetical protein
MHHLLQWAVAGTTFLLHPTAAALQCLPATGLLLLASVEPTQLLFALALPDVDALLRPFEDVADRSAVHFPDHLSVDGRDRVHLAHMDQGVAVEAGTLVAGNIAIAEVARLVQMLAGELQQVEGQEQRQQEVLVGVEGV